jgi:hypothetical protein
MSLTNKGRDFLATAYTGNATPVFDNTHARIGVGDSSTAFAVGQVDLQAAANKFRKPMDATYPVTVANVTTYKSTFASADANFAWNEWGIFNSSAGDTMLNRVVEYNGTKLAGQTWIFQITITVNIGA